jgi:hypothetical protein
MVLSTCSGTTHKHNGRKVVDVAQAIVDSYLLLPPPSAEAATPQSDR